LQAAETEIVSLVDHLANGKEMVLGAIGEKRAAVLQLEV